ncbi:chemotaxis protein CheY [Candidatus Magnetomorum sp. HK-1]|nr:chemotaxis protein CheY [Candidatus Magnetomorum sp. HK-1]
MNTDKTIQLLLIEDNPGDIYLMTSKLKDLSIPISLNVAVDGTEASDFLQQKGKYKDVQIPDIIILDLNLPRIDGREILNYIKSDSTLANVPLFILSASDEDEDILKKYDPLFNKFLKKPRSLKSFQLIIDKIENFIQRNL